MANYPGSVSSFTTKNNGDTVQASHVDDLQAEVTAIENALINGLAHNLVTSGLLTVTGFGAHTINGGGVGANSLSVRNATAGVGNQSVLYLGNDADQSNLYIKSYSSTFSAAGAEQPSGGLLSANGTGGLSILAQDAGGVIRFYAGGTTRRVLLSAAGIWTWDAYSSGSATFVVGDKYLVVNATGVVHVSALGPLS